MCLLLYHQSTAASLSSPSERCFPSPLSVTSPPPSSLLLRALACWDCRPSPPWLAAYFTASHPRLSEARPAHISCQLSALAKLGLTAPGPWLDEALGSFCAQLPEAKAHDLVSKGKGGGDLV